MQLARKSHNMDVIVNVARLRLANEDTKDSEDQLPVSWLASGPRPKKSNHDFDEAFLDHKKRIKRAMQYDQSAGLRAHPIIKQDGQVFRPFFARDRVVGYFGDKGQWLGRNEGYAPRVTDAMVSSSKIAMFCPAREFPFKPLCTAEGDEIGFFISPASLAEPLEVLTDEGIRMEVAYPVIKEYTVVGYIPISEEVSTEELPQELRWLGDSDRLGRREDGAWILVEVGDDYHAWQPRFQSGRLYLPLVPPPGAPQQKNVEFVAIRDFVSDKALSGEPYGNGKRVWGCAPFVMELHGFAVALHPTDPKCRIDGYYTPLIDTDGVAIGFVDPVTFKAHPDYPVACPPGIGLSRNSNGTVAVTPFRGLLLGLGDGPKLLEGPPLASQNDEPRPPDDSNNQDLGDFVKLQGEKIMESALHLTALCRPLKHAGLTYYPLVNGNSIIGFLNDHLEWYPLTFAPGGYDFSNGNISSAESTHKDGDLRKCFITPATYAEPVWDASGNSILAFPVLDEGNIKGYVPAGAHLSVPNGLVQYGGSLLDAKRRNTDGAWELRPRPDFLAPQWRDTMSGYQVPVIAPTDEDTVLRGASVELRTELSIQDRAWWMSYKQYDDGLRVVYRPDQSEGEEIDYFPLADSEQRVVALVNEAGIPHPSTPLPFGACAAYDERVRVWRLYSRERGDYASLDDFAGLVPMPALSFRERLAQCKLTKRDMVACGVIAAIASVVAVSVAVGLTHRARSSPGEDLHSEWLTKVIDWFNSTCFSEYFAASGRYPDLDTVKAIAEATFRDVAATLEPEEFGCPSDITGVSPARMYAAAQEYLGNVTQSLANTPAPAASASFGSSHALLVTALLVMLHMFGFLA